MIEPPRKIRDVPGMGHFATYEEWLINGRTVIGCPSMIKLLIEHEPPAPAQPKRPQIISVPSEEGPA